MKTIEECKANIQEFANRFKLIFDEQGEIGIGRECVGLRDGLCYVACNPTRHTDYEYIDKFYDERLSDIAPKNAYHKADYIAVLGRGETAIRELSEWVEKLNELGAVVETYNTGATGIQATFSGVYGHAVRIPKLVSAQPEKEGE